MINVIQTLKNLNKEFPRFQLETLLKIVECIQEDYYTKTYPDWWSKDITYKNYPVYCTQNDASTCTLNNTPNEAFVYNTTTKNHAADKTSHNQTITSEGENASGEDLISEEDLKDLADVFVALSSAYNPKHQ